MLSLVVIPHHTNLMFKRSKFCKDPSSLTLIKIIEMNITFTEEIVQKAKIFVQTIMYNRELQDVLT